MANQSGIEWVVPPAKLQENLKQYGNAVPAAVMAVAEFNATKGQNEMRMRAIWVDRTGNARGGLMGIAVREDKNIVIYFIHSVEYGRWLELANAGKYAIVWPITLEIGPQVMAMLRRSLA